MSAPASSPLVGFNNNVRYRGMSFHIQTEDSGVARPFIVTHLFADGGRVIKTLRIDYSEHLHHPDYRASVQRLMREQHRAMAYDLREGRVDASIDALDATVPPEPFAPPAAAVEQAPPQPSGSAPPTATSGRPSPGLDNGFGALPPSSLDELIVRYVARVVR